MVTADETKRIVLLADDDNLVRDMIADGFAGSAVPIDVIQCKDGVKALAVVRAMMHTEMPLDLLILDMVMEVMNGDEVGAAVRREEGELGRDPVPIVFVTSLDATDNRVRSALSASQPAAHLDKRTCKDGVELANQLVLMAQSCFISVSDQG